MTNFSTIRAQLNLVGCTHVFQMVESVTFFKSGVYCTLREVTKNNMSAYQVWVNFENSLPIILTSNQFDDILSLVKNVQPEKEEEHIPLFV